MNVNVVNSKSDYKKVSHGLGECEFCGYKHVFGKSNCSAVNKNCASCGAQGHFKKKCPNKGNGTKQKSRQVRYAQHRPVSEDENDTSDEEHERLVGHLQVMKIKKPGDICSVKNKHECVSDDTDKFRLSGYHGTLLLLDNQICRIIGYLFPLDINLICKREI